jgi:riboflavin kinase/FMN adenylyltransferase
MKVFSDLTGIGDMPETAIALGNFDGVHLGHAALIRRMTAHARERGLAPAVFTFRNNPYNAIMGGSYIRGIMTEDEKEEIIGALGVEYMFAPGFDESFHTMPAKVFIDELLLGAFRARAVFCGFNFRFGAEAAGDPELLREAGGSRGFDVSVMEPYRVDGALVSSTLIRGLIESGEAAAAAKFLGRPFAISGEISRGNGVGRGLGFPTANISLPEGLVAPAYGVYVTESELTDIEAEAVGYDPDGAGDDGGEPAGSSAGAVRGGSSEPMRSVTNVGVRPTIGDERLLAETHVFGVPDEDLYGHRIRVNFLSMIRPERKFSGTEELKTQVERDKRLALAYKAPPHTLHGGGDARTAELLMYISNNMDRVNLSSMASDFGYSAGYLCRLIKKLTGSSFSDIVQRVRLDRARDMLENSSVGIAKIAASTGYCDTSNFYKAFRKRYGMTPARYRRQAAGAAKRDGNS